MRIFIGVSVCTLLMVCGSLYGQEAPKHWHKYVNKTFGFSLRYPDSYRRVPFPPPTLSQEYWHTRNHTKRLLLLQRRDDPHAKIWVSVEVRPFTVHTIWKSHAPTGYDEDYPPPPGQIGEHTFVRFGAGGGGVEYADQYFTNLKGKILDIDFDGPYDEKSPDQKTQELEPKILATLHIN